MQNIESVEKASFHLLEMASVKLKNNQVKQQIRENDEEVKADRRLMLLITAKYVTSVYYRSGKITLHFLNVLLRVSAYT